VVSLATGLSTGAIIGIAAAAGAVAVGMVIILAIPRARRAVFPFRDRGHGARGREEVAQSETSRTIIRKGTKQQLNAVVEESW
jgi:hypothetical protein